MQPENDSFFDRQKGLESVNIKSSCFQQFSHLLLVHSRVLFIPHLTFSFEQVISYDQKARIECIYQLLPVGSVKVHHVVSLEFPVTDVLNLLVNAHITVVHISIFITLLFQGQAGEYRHELHVSYNFHIVVGHISLHFLQHVVIYGEKFLYLFVRIER